MEVKGTGGTGISPWQDNSKVLPPHSIGSGSTCCSSDIQNMWSNTNRPAKRNRQVHDYSWNFSATLLAANRKTEVSKSVEEFSNTISQQDIVGIFRILHLNIAEYILPMDHIPGHTLSWGRGTNFSKRRRIEIIQSVFSNSVESKWKSRTETS